MRIPYIHGDATRDETLIEAGIERARGLVAALGRGCRQCDDGP